MALGLLGGAFDPPHLGHLRLARAAIDGLGLERLLVLVVEDPGHKIVSTPSAARLELARVAFAAIPEAEVELDRHERTADSLEERLPQDAYFVMGTDELADFWSWRRPDRILELVRLAVAVRPGVPEDELRASLRRFPPGSVAFFEMEPIQVSSTEVRRRAARGEAIEGLVSPAVAEAIARLGLYTSGK